MYCGDTELSRDDCGGEVCDIYRRGVMRLTGREEILNVILLNGELRIQLCISNVQVEKGYHH